MIERKLTYNEELLYESIPIGICNAIRGNDLAEITGFNRRDIRFLLNSLLEKGYAVCSLSVGYFRPKNKDELRQAQRYYNSYVREFLRKEQYIQEIINNF